MANMIIENILNKDEYYERIRQENSDLKEQSIKLQSTLTELKKKTQTLENTNKELTSNLQIERQRY